MRSLLTIKRICSRKSPRRYGDRSPTFGDAVTTWIYRVALNAAIAWTRKEWKHSESKQSVNGVDLAILQASPVADPRIEWLYAQIRELNAIDRSLTLLLLDGFSYKEMASVLGITENHVGVKISRIKAYLTTKSREEFGHGV